MLVELSPTVFVNPSHVELVELDVDESGPIVRITVNGIIRVSKREPTDLIKEIHEANTNPFEQHERY